MGFADRRVFEQVGRAVRERPVEPLGAGVDALGGIPTDRQSSDSMPARRGATESKATA